MLVRTLGGALGTAALVLAGVAPASAHGDHHHHHGHHAHEVKVVVCARFDDHHHYQPDGSGGDAGATSTTTTNDNTNGDNHGDDNDEVSVSVRTDEDHGYARLGDRECARFELRFDDNWLSVRAWPSNDGRVEFKTVGDVERSYSRDNALKVQFDDRTRDPFVGVGLLVEDHHGHDHHGRHHGDSHHHARHYQHS